MDSLFGSLAFFIHGRKQENGKARKKQGKGKKKQGKKQGKSKEKARREKRRLDRRLNGRNKETGMKNKTEVSLKLTVGSWRGRR